MAVAAIASTPPKSSIKRWQAGRWRDSFGAAERPLSSPRMEVQQQLSPITNGVHHHRPKVLVAVVAAGWWLVWQCGMAYLWLLYRSAIKFHLIYEPNVLHLPNTERHHGNSVVDNHQEIVLSSYVFESVPLEDPNTFDEDHENSHNTEESTFVLLEPSGKSRTASTLPTWMTDYFSWHREQIQSLTAENWRSHRFLVSRCLTIDRACGGTSDRLQSLPTLLLLAAESRRLFMFEWSRPAPIETYLLPTQNLNWTLPSFVPAKGLGTRLFTKMSSLLHATTSSLDRNNTMTVSVLCARLQDSRSVAQYYNEHPWNTIRLSNNKNNGPLEPFRRDFRLLFFAVMTPSPHVLRQYQKEQRALFPSIHTSNPTYTVAHVRANYGNSAVPNSQIQAVTQNAVNCAIQLEKNNGDVVPQPLILLISDSAPALQSLPHYDHSQFVVVTTTLPYRSDRPPEPLHLDKDTGASAQDYLDVFVDLLHFANAHCISHGIGGFGQFGVLLSRDPSCFFKYIDQGQFYECSLPEKGNSNAKLAYA